MSKVLRWEVVVHDRRSGTLVICKKQFSGTGEGFDAFINETRTNGQHVFQVRPIFRTPFLLPGLPRLLGEFFSQPIDTAPRDGTLVLIWTCDEWAPARWRDGWWQFEINGGPVFDHSEAEEQLHEEWVMYWMPMPGVPA